MKQAAVGAASATQAVKADKKPFFSQRTLSHFIDFLFVLPALILLGVFTYYPIVKLVQISFTDWNLLNDTWKYVGLKNWQWLFAGSGAKYLWNSLKVTFLYSMGEILVTMVGGMLLALLFNRMTRSFGLMRAFVFVPKYVAMSSAAVVFLWILNTDSGVLNYLLQCIGLPAVDWLNQQSTALPSVLMLTGWRVIGYGMMIYLSAMMGISQEYYEAASLDGANGVQKFFRITLPSIAPGIFTGALLSFALTLDDVVMADFLAGPNCLTFPMKIYNSIRKGVSPEINALETIISGLIFLGVAVYLLLKGRQDRAAAKIEPFHQTQTEN